MNSPYFTQISSEIIQRLEKAQHEILVAVAWFTNPILFEVLKNRRKAQVQLEIMISDDAHNFGKLPFEQLLEIGGRVWVKETRQFSLMHNKYCVIDKKLLITGSYNWSVKAETNFENIFITDDSLAVDRYYHHFNKVLKHDGFFLFSTTKVGSFRKETEWEGIEDTRLFLLEKDFNEEANQNIQTALRAGVDLNLDLIYGMMERYSAVGAARRLTTSDEGKKIQNALKLLWKKKLLRLSFERMILKQKYNALFKDAVKDLARKKLATLKYYPDESTDD